MNKLLFVSLFTVLPLCTGCICPLRSVGKPSPYDTVQPLRSLILPYGPPARFTGYGSLIVRFQGEKYSGSFDLVHSGEDLLNVVFYGPFGTPFGSITTAGDSGTVTVQDYRETLPLDRRLDTLRFPWGGGLTLKQLTDVLCGRMILAGAFSDEPPHVIVSHWFRKELLWERDTLSVSLLFSSNLKSLERTLITDKRESGRVYKIEFDNYADGFPHFISLKADDRNYFSINYRKMKR